MSNSFVTIELVNFLIKVAISKMENEKKEITVNNTKFTFTDECVKIHHKKRNLKIKKFIDGRIEFIDGDKQKLIDLINTSKSWAKSADIYLNNEIKKEQE